MQATGSFPLSRIINGPFDPEGKQAVRRNMKRFPDDFMFEVIKGLCTLCTNVPIDLSYDPTKYIVTVHGFRGSKVAFLSPYVILQTFCTGKPTASTSPQTCPPLPTSWDMPVPYMTGEAGGSGTWYLTIIHRALFAGH